jgi:hypothetical protein
MKNCTETTDRSHRRGCLISMPSITIPSYSIWPTSTIPKCLSLSIVPHSYLSPSTYVRTDDYRTWGEGEVVEVCWKRKMWTESIYGTPLRDLSIARAFDRFLAYHVSFLWYLSATGVKEIFSGPSSPWMQNSVPWTPAPDFLWWYKNANVYFPTQYVLLPVERIDCIWILCRTDRAIIFCRPVCAILTICRGYVG